MNVEHSNTPIEDEDEITHNCGIAAVHDPDGQAGALTQSMLYSLNHRGQEGAGIFVRSSDGSARVRKGSGWVREALGEREVKFLQEESPIFAEGQTRYSTAGRVDAWQPFTENDVALVHNGNLTNYQELLEQLPEEEQEDPKSDSWVAQRLIVLKKGETWEEKVASTAQEMEGAFNIIVQADQKLLAVRDPLGMRPMVLGRLPNGGTAVASETSAFSPIGATYVREVDPGEGVVIDEEGLRTFFTDSRTDPEKIARCIFELIYISAPDSIMFGKRVKEIRQRMGELLAVKDLEDGLIPDLITAVLNSGKFYADGYEKEMRKHLGLQAPEREDIIIANPYMGRSFIRASGREDASKIKHRVIPYELEGKKVTVIDDSIVRGSTSGKLVHAMTTQPLQFGFQPPSEIHLRSGAPMIMHPCFMGVDFSTKEELVANQGNGDVEQIRKLIHDQSLTSIRYLSHTELLTAVVGEEQVENLLDKGLNPEDLYSCTGHCGACFTGRYPLEIKSVYSKTHSAK